MSTVMIIVGAVLLVLAFVWMERDNRRKEAAVRQWFEVDRPALVEQYMEKLRDVRTDLTQIAAELADVRRELDEKETR